MPTNLEWSDIAIRLLCTVVVGGGIGFNRGEHGRPAGLRTTLLVSLAACLAMIQVNLLLITAGRPGNSFVMVDPMRLPLGILSGIGFIGAGAIVRRDNFVLGVTTAATIWYVTVLGLLFGGGQIALGLVGSAIGVIVLTVFKMVEDRMKQDREGRLSLMVDASGPAEQEIRDRLAQPGLNISSCAFAHSLQTRSTELDCTLRWRATARENQVPEVVRTLAQNPGVLRVAWTPQVK